MTKRPQYVASWADQEVANQEVNDLLKEAQQQLVKAIGEMIKTYLEAGYLLKDMRLEFNPTTMTETLKHKGKTLATFKLKVVLGE